MGGGTSKAPVDKVDIDLATLPGPVVRDDLKLFSVVPVDEDLKRRSAVLLLEVGDTGFRLLKSGSEDPILLFPWGQIHSWAHGDSRFTFRFFDDGKRTVMQHNLSMRDVDELLDHIKLIIDKILDERRKSGISDEAFEKLIEQLKAASSDSARQLELIKQAVALNTFLADKGREVLDLLPTAFEKIEAATILHSKLIDQNRFCTMLEALDCQADRDNVWHRITLMKKSTSGVR